LEERFPEVGKGELEAEFGEILKAEARVLDESV
jgi:hypothetical protein